MLIAKGNFFKKLLVSYLPMESMNEHDVFTSANSSSLKLITRDPESLSDLHASFPAHLIPLKSMMSYLPVTSYHEAMAHISEC